MKVIRVAAVSLNQTAGDWSGNAARIKEALDELNRREVSVACLPELCISGYGCEDSFSHPVTSHLAQKALKEILPHTKGLVVNLGLPIFLHRALYNCTVVCADGEILGVIPKKSLAGDGIHYEPRWFKAWPEGITDQVRLFGAVYPIGDLIFDIQGVRVGYEICEEAWTTERPARKHAASEVDIECNPSASHFAFGKKKIRDLFVLEGSRAFSCAYVYANLLGCESGRQIYDGGNLIALDGEMIARGERFTYGDHLITTADIDIDYSRTLVAKKHWADPKPGQDIEGVTCVESSFAVREIKKEGTLQYQSVGEEGWEYSDSPNFEEFVRAVSLALFDYMRKSRLRGFVVSLSGGCDSSSVSLLAGLAVGRAFRALGVEGMRERLGYLNDSEVPASEEELRTKFLTTVWQQTKNNSLETKEAAQAVAKSVGSLHHEVEIDEWVASYQQEIERCLGGEGLTYEKDGLVLQNLQARLRNPLPWALANAEGKLLLTTSNRSESALGYCTMDGDTAGGLNPIGGVDKAFLRRWLVWMEKVGPSGDAPVEGLHKVNTLTPSAELLPLEAHQSDEGELGPYEVCAFIEEHFMRRAQSPVEIYPELLATFGKEYSSAELMQWLRKFFILFARNQWKRERLAPCFHVDHMNLDPRTWCRWPILNGGFAEELEELEAKYGVTYH
ncbi:NAD(+) synthase [bacterium]|nr:NAD(+) synthase [bacterium]